MTAWIEDRTAAVIASLGAGRLIADLEAAGHDVTALREAARRARSGRSAGRPVAPKWITVEQAAAELGVTTRTVRRWCAAGRLVARQGFTRGTWNIETVGVAALAAHIACPSNGHSIDDLANS